MSNNNEVQTCTFYVEGMHCAACELTIEKKLKNVAGVEFVDAILDKGIVKIKGHFNDNPETLAREFTDLVKEDGYEIHTEKATSNKNFWNDFLIALPFALFIIIGFLALERFGVISSLSPQEISLPAVFLIGFVASLSSCAAVVGGLVLSLSANEAKDSQKVNYFSQIIFHISRLLSFFILGGVIGVIGSTFRLSVEASFILNVIIAVVMIILALNLLDISDFTKRLQFTMPKSFSRSIINLKNPSTTYAPVLLGFITFFLPCGFTQSMQIYALGTGSFIEGAVVMLFFALGTFPVLALISFTSIKLTQNNKFRGIFFKAAGLIVLFFAIINLFGAFTIIGFTSPF